MVLSGRDLYVFHVVVGVQIERIDALVDSHGRLRRRVARGADDVLARRVLLESDVLVVLDDVLLDFVCFRVFRNGRRSVGEWRLGRGLFGLLFLLLGGSCGLGFCGSGRWSSWVLFLLEQLEQEGSLPILGQSGLLGHLVLGGVLASVG